MDELVSVGPEENASENPVEILVYTCSYVRPRLYIFQGQDHVMLDAMNSSKGVLLSFFTENKYMFRLHR